MPRVATSFEPQLVGRVGEEGEGVSTPGENGALPRTPQEPASLRRFWRFAIYHACVNRQDVLTTQQAARLLGCSRQHVVDRHLLRFW